MYKILSPLPSLSGAGAAELWTEVLAKSGEDIRDEEKMTWSPLPPPHRKPLLHI